MALASGHCFSFSYFLLLFCYHSGSKQTLKLLQAAERHSDIDTKVGDVARSAVCGQTLLAVQCIQRLHPGFPSRGFRLVQLLDQQGVAVSDEALKFVLDTLLGARRATESLVMWQRLEEGRAVGGGAENHRTIERYDLLMRCILGRTRGPCVQDVDSVCALMRDMNASGMRVRQERLDSVAAAIRRLASQAGGGWADRHLATVRSSLISRHPHPRRPSV